MVNTHENVASTGLPKYKLTTFIMKADKPGRGNSLVTVRIHHCNSSLFFPARLTCLARKALTQPT